MSGRRLLDAWVDGDEPRALVGDGPRVELLRGADAAGAAAASPIAARLARVAGEGPMRAPRPLGDVRGRGTFTIPFGPVRSGVVESMLYDVATAGEDMLRVVPRPGFKRRGLERRMCGVPLARVPVMAERMAGVFSVAGALAVCQALERAAGVEVAPEAEAVRLVLAELERVFNHCDAIMRHCDDASLAVGTAQVGMLKERTLRLLAELTGHRYGRGVVTVGGVRRGLDRSALRDWVAGFDRDGRRVRRLLLDTASFLDRLERTGRLSSEDAARGGASGPLARGSRLAWDARVERPYGAYVRHPVTVAQRSDGDVMARFEVRLFEVRESLRLLDEVAGAVDLGAVPPVAPVAVDRGAVGIGWAEAPEGEWLAVVEGGADGTLARCRVRPASLLNLGLFERACEGWVLTDFAFIEQSFGVSVAGFDR
jgi:formate hydrogenlyase subunit 5